MSSQRLTIPFSICMWRRISMRRQGLDIVFLAYGIGDLQHGSGSGSLVAAHDVLELDI
jgi:hypothetical protein